MQETTPIVGTAEPPVPIEKYNDEQVRQLVTALEEPFDAHEIKWRVTNTTADRRRGQVIAYADPRAYTDRLNALFSVCGWTREYTIQVIQNFERKERGNGGGIISGKIVVTCKLTINVLGSHAGLGEEWADNENAGTSAEAQAFKRACSCFGLGRYLYDLGGNWVDLDERRQPLSKPKLPDWALPKRNATAYACGNRHNHVNGNGHLNGKHGGAPDMSTLKTRAKSLCEQVGFGLARSVVGSIAGVDGIDGIQDANVLSAVSLKLEDTLRGVERLRTATGVAGQTVLAKLCREINLAGDTLDDIPDRRTLRQLIETLEKAAGTIQASAKCNGDHGEPPRRQNGTNRNPVGAARADLIREAQRVGKLRGMRVSDVIDRAAKGAFRFAELQRLTAESLPVLIAATDILRRVTPEPVEQGNPAILIYSGADPSTSR
jgi:hypothetical protein